MTAVYSNCEPIEQVDNACLGKHRAISTSDSWDIDLVNKIYSHAEVGILCN